MSKVRILMGAAKDLTYLISSNHSRKNKAKIFKKWLKINLKYFFSSSKRRGGEKFDKYTFISPLYSNIQSLFDEIFMKGEYYIKLKNGSPTIIDCGANIGFATIFFKWVYPKSEIFSFEPEPNTFKILKQNVDNNKLEKVKIYNKALSSEEGRIVFYSEGLGSLGASLNKKRGGRIRCIVDSIKLSNFIKAQKIKKIDLVKMDIEGAEDEVIRDLDENGVLKMVDNFIIEYHHKINGTSKSNLSSFLGIFERNGFEYQINTISKPLNKKNKFQDILIYFYRI